jgi:hypothetical protein
MLGTPIAAAIDHFTRTYGQPAANEVAARVPAPWAGLLRPNAPSLGVLGARRYPYPFVGDLVYTMRTVVHHPDEDQLIRDLAIAGIDAAMGTVIRFVVRWTATPAMIARKAQDSWGTVHDTGRVTVLSLTDHEYLRKVTDWRGHDATVCKLTMEVAAHAIAMTGAKNVRCRREACVAWGNDDCIVRVQWD